MDATQAARLARLIHHCGVDHPQTDAQSVMALQAALGEKSQAQLVQPALGFAEALEQGDVRKVRQPGLPGADRGLSQGVAATQMHQQYSQTILLRFVLPQPFQGTGLARGRLPVKREK